MSFAMLEMTTLLASFVRAFRFSTVPGHRLAIDARLTTRPKDGMPLLIEPVRASRTQTEHRRRNASEDSAVRI